MIKKLLFAAFIFTFLGIKAQTNADKELLLQGFNEAKVKQELIQKGLDPKECMDGMRRRYMAKRAKELGFLNQSKAEHEHVSINKDVVKGGHPVPNNARNGNHNTILSSGCNNSSFQLLNFTGWSGDTGTVNESLNTWVPASSYYMGPGSIVPYAPLPLNSPLAEQGPGPPLYTPTTNRHNIMNTPPTNNNPLSSTFSGYDSLAISPTTHLSVIPFLSPSGSGTSLRLGNATGGGETESITYSLPVTSSTSLFTYQYAVVLANPSSSPHASNQQPQFIISVLDQYGYPIDSLTPCATYSVNTGLAATDTTFVENTGDMYNDFQDVFYKPWTSVSIDLTSYVGQTITIQFQTFDCAYTAHYCYAYIDAFCGSPASASSVSGFCGVTSGSVTIVAPPGFSSYQWYGPSPNNTTPAVGSGVNTATLTTTATINDTFTVKTVSPSGCNSTFKIVVKPTNILVTTSSIATCLGGSGGSVTASAGTGAFSYSWQGPSGALGTNTVVTNLPPGSYTCSITDNTHQCPTLDTIIKVLAVNPSLQSTTEQFCGTQPTLSAPHHAFAGSAYTWYNNSNTLMAGVTTQTNTISGAATGQHYIVTYLDSATHCEDSVKLTLNKVNLVYDSIANPTCGGGNDGSLTYSNVSSTNLYPSYTWTVTGALNSNGTSPSSTAIVLNNLTVGNYTMIISAPGNPTCSDTLKNKIVSSTGIVVPHMDSTHAICNMDTLILNNAVPNVTHSWTGPNIIYGANTTATLTVYPSPSFTNSVLGFYTYTDSMRAIPGNCLSINKYVIKIKSFKASNITLIEPLKCPGDTIAKIKASVTSEKNGPINTPDKYTFTWSSSNSIYSPNPTYGTGVPASSVLSNLKAGTYTCVISNGNCIEDVTYNLIGIPPLPIDTIYAYYCPKDSLALLVADTGGRTNYLWHPSNTGASVTGDSITVPTQNINSYYVTYKYNNCPDTGKIIVNIRTHNAFVPNELVNVFSPNGDNVNDVFYPLYQKNMSQYEIAKQSNNNVYELKIYDRWGTLMFETTDYSTPWNGKTKSGHDADDGTYFFYVMYESNCATNADKAVKKGFIELMRGKTN